ncbi:MAG: hypothetical protein SFW62_03625 [Alphaproteobacteria bacterium]|nr:hypothetical protein [Alphaproteobacteria bacterium]
MSSMKRLFVAAGIAACAATSGCTTALNHHKDNVGIVGETSRGIINIRTGLEQAAANASDTINNIVTNSIGVLENKLRGADGQDAAAGQESPNSTPSVPACMVQGSFPNPSL